MIRRSSPTDCITWALSSGASFAGLTVIWKVDDARRENGHVYNLQIEGGSFDLVRLTRERVD